MIYKAIFYLLKGDYKRSRGFQDLKSSGAELEFTAVQRRRNNVFKTNVLRGVTFFNPQRTKIYPIRSPYTKAE